MPAPTSPPTYWLVDPTTQPLVPAFTAAPRVPDLRHKRLGILDNSKEKARELLAEMTSLLQERYEVAQVHYYRKPSASKPATPAMIAELAQACDYAVIAVGS